MRTHCNGAAQLMARVQVRRLFLPEQESDSREAILTAAERCGTEIVFVTEDLTLDFSGGSPAAVCTGPARLAQLRPCRIDVRGRI